VKRLRVPTFHMPDCYSSCLMAGTVVKVAKCLNPQDPGDPYALLTFDTGETVASAWRYEDPDMPWWPEIAAECAPRVEHSTHTIVQDGRPVGRSWTEREFGGAETRT